MTVSELIAELQRQPQGKPVRVLMSEIYWADESGEGSLTPSEAEAIEADRVTFEGGFVLIRSK